MCRSKAQGGQRCFAEAERTLRAAEDALRVADNVARFAANTSDVFAIRDRERRVELAERVKQATIDYATTARGMRNISMIADAHADTGDSETAHQLRRWVTRGMARRRVNDTTFSSWKAAHADEIYDSDCVNWTPPHLRGDTPRCPLCGQFIRPRSYHCCPPALLQAQRERLLDAVTAASRAPDSHAQAVTANITAAWSADLPMTTAEEGAALAVCVDDAYGPATATATLDVALERAWASVLAEADEYTDDGDPLPVLLYQGALEPFARPAKRDSARAVAAQLAATPDEDLFDADDCTALSRPAEYEWTLTPEGALMFGPWDGGFKQIGDGGHMKSEGAPLDPADNKLHTLARQAIVSQTMSHWAVHTTDNPEPVITQIQAAARDTYLTPGPAVGDLHARLARAVVTAQYRATQQYFAEHGVTEITVSRGMMFRPERVPSWVPADRHDRQIGSVPLNPLTSFTTRAAVASAFAKREWDGDHVSVRIHGTIPVDRVLSTPRTGMGCLSESEVVVLAGPGDWEIERV